jgi:hypothetical protein
VLIDVTFDIPRSDGAFLTFLRGLWQSATAGQILRGAPQARIAAVAQSQQV